jgi:RNA polymerase sigma-70 factor, ECF subfamily
MNTSWPAPAHDTETQWMVRVRDGETAYLNRLVERHRKPLVGYLYRMIQDEAAAEDLAQEAFLRVYKARHSYVPSARFSTWLYRIATNLTLNWIRDHRAEENREPIGSPDSLADERPPAEQALIRGAERGEVRRAIASLPTRQRCAVILHKYDGLPYAQIAEVMGTSEQAVRSLIFRAHQVLRERLAHLVRRA